MIRKRTIFYRKRGRGFPRTILLLLVGTVVAVIITINYPGTVLAHGAMASPISRAYACYLEGPEHPTSPACKAAVAKGGTQPLYDWNEINIADGHLCSAGKAKYAAFDEPRTDWPSTTLQSGAQYTFQYKATAPHTGTFELYVTKNGYDPTQPLKWSDLEEAPFLKITDPPLVNGVYEWTGTLPSGKSGKHIIYTIWQRSTSPEAFYGCSDVIFGATSDSNPNPTPTPTTGSMPTPTPISCSTFTPTPTPTIGSTPTSTPISTLTPTSTPCPPSTLTPTPCPTSTVITGSTPTPTSMPDATSTPTPTPSPTFTPTPTFTPCSTLTPTPCPTSTVTTGSTPTPIPSPTSTPNLTPTPSPTSTPNPTSTCTPCSTSTPTPGSSLIPTPGVNMGSFLYGVDAHSSTNLRSWFQSCGWSADYVILHYIIPGQVQENVYTTYAGDSGRWGFDTNRMQSGQILKYSFTYSYDYRQYDTVWYTWTQP